MNDWKELNYDTAPKNKSILVYCPDADKELELTIVQIRDQDDIYVYDQFDLDDEDEGQYKLYADGKTWKLTHYMEINKP